MRRCSGSLCPREWVLSSLEGMSSWRHGDGLLQHWSGRCVALVGAGGSVAISDHDYFTTEDIPITSTRKLAIKFGAAARPCATAERLVVWALRSATFAPAPFTSDYHLCAGGEDIDSDNEAVADGGDDTEKERHVSCNASLLARVEAEKQRAMTSASSWQRGGQRDEIGSRTRQFPGS